MISYRDLELKGAKVVIRARRPGGGSQVGLIMGITVL
jgi:hypothetical protein